jgi:hypothetical protein
MSPGTIAGASMPDGEWSLGELGRRQEHLEGQYAQDHNELRAEYRAKHAELLEEVKWTRRLLIGTVGIALLASIVNAALGVLRPPV